ncbi:MAG: DinB family protein [Rhodanobacteraceae bacterium]|nr:MAG: DinB family protein [Rhodanobacteraceae bacterium]
MSTLISNLGKTRLELLARLEQMPQTRLDEPLPNHTWSVSDVVRHLHGAEKELVATVLDSLSNTRDPVPERDLSHAISDYEAAHPCQTAAPAATTRAELVALLGESRFAHLQHLFNKVHEEDLLAKSVEHPVFGPVSLKNLIDFIWIHEAYHLAQIPVPAVPAAAR